MTDDFNTDDFRRRARSNLRTGLVFNALANAIRRGETDDAKLWSIAMDAERMVVWKEPNNPNSWL